MTKSEMYSLKEVALATGLKYYQIEYMIKAGKIKEPKRISGMRLFTEKDVKNIIKERK
jgi:DNA-binding transcriptional MerR regulator